MKKIIFLFLLIPSVVLAEKNTTNPDDILLFNFLNTLSENGQFLYRTGKDLITTTEQLETIFELKLTKINNVALPDGLKKLKQLKRLNFSGNRSSSLPQCMESFKELQELDLSDNDFECIPPVIQKLPALTSLNFHSNKLNSISSNNNPFEHLNKLEFLNLSSNPLIYFHNSVVNFKSLPELKELDLSNCNLFEIPEGISQLTSLEKLHFHSNKIATFGGIRDIEIFKELGYLKELDVSNNHIHTFFNGFSMYIQSLEVLSLRNNSFHVFPLDFYKLIHLKKIFIERKLLNNSIDRMPINFIKNSLYNSLFECLFLSYKDGGEGLENSLSNIPGPTENLKIK